LRDVIVHMFMLRPDMHVYSCVFLGLLRDLTMFWLQQHLTPVVEEKPTPVDTGRFNERINFCGKGNLCTC